MAGILDALAGMFGGGQSDPWQGMRETSSPQPAPAPAPQQAAPAPQSSGGGIGDFLSALGPAIAMIDPRNQQLGMGLMQMQQGRQQQRAKQENMNQTAQWLQTKGVGQTEASFIASNPEALREWYKNFSEGNKPDWQISEIYNDQGQKMKALVDRKSGRYSPIGGAADPAKNGEGEYGLTPQYGVDANGNPVLIQVGKSGSAVQTKMPDGVTLSKEPIKLDAGTHFVLLDPISRQPVGQIAKNVAGEAEAKEFGKSTAEAKAALPQIEGAANQMLGTIDSIISDPYLPSMVGSIDGRKPNFSSSSNRFQSKLDQLQGQTFLQAYNSLRGGGQITEVEGTKAERAMARLNTAQSEEDFKQALGELRDVVQGAVSRARQKTGGASSPSTASGAGGVVDYSDFFKQ